MSSDKKKVAKKRGNVMSTVLVLAAVAAAGGVGKFLWNYQARLDTEAPAPVAAAAEPFPDPVEGKQPEAWVTELLPTTPHPAAAPKVTKPVRGDIKIVGKNGTTAGVAPPTAEDLAAAARNGNSNYGGPPAVYSTGPQIYQPDDPNRYQPRPAYRSGRPRYYDFESNRSRVDDYDPTFQRRTTVKQSN